MSNRNSALQLLVGAILFVSAGMDSAEALNPQPLPPFQLPHNGLYRTQDVRGVNAMDSRFQRQAYLRNGRSGLLTAVYGSGAHRLNPQPLPPG